MAMISAKPVSGIVGKPPSSTSSYRSMSEPQLGEKPPGEASTSVPSQNFVSCVYRTKVADLYRHVTATWSKNLINHSLQLIVENPFDDENHYSCRIDLNTWQFWGKKGLKSFKVDDEKRVDVFWDLRSAKFSTSPEPVANYYIALVSEGELVLLLGDREHEAFKRAKAKPSLEGSVLVHKEENVFGKKCFTAKTMLGKAGKDHHITIEVCFPGHFEPEMLIGIDGIVAMRIVNLHWRFRGYETIVVDDLPVRILWDVHDWLYIGADLGPGIFIFKQCKAGLDPEHILYDDILTSEEDSMEFCHFLYAWMIE